MQSPHSNSLLSVGATPAPALDFEHECVEFFADVVQILGVPRSMGQIYGILFASPSPLSFTDIVGRLDISKGSASQGLQALRSLGAVRTIEGGGDRREHFVPELGLRQLIGGVLRGKLEPVLHSGNTRLQRMREAAGEIPSSTMANFSRQQVKQLERWRRQIKLLLPILNTLLRSGSA